MHVKKGKIMAMLGVMAALSTVLTVLGTLISVNTVFFTAAAAFLVGIVVVSYGFSYGTCFFLVCSALDFFINPNKLHVFLYLALGGYILLAEGSFKIMEKRLQGRTLNYGHRFLRFIIFELMYVPVLLLVPQLLVAHTLLEKTWFLPAMLGLGIVAWLIYDWAYACGKATVYRYFKKAF